MEFLFSEYADMYLILGECHKNFNAAVRLYAERYPARRHPVRSVLVRLDRRLRETGSVAANNVDRGRPRTRRTPEFEEEVLQMVDDDPGSSTRKIGRLVEVNHTTVHQILADEHLYPYHMTKVQALHPEDYNNRILYCEWLLEKQRIDNNFAEKVLWTDEAIFTRDGVFNCHNLHEWAVENPHAAFQLSTWNIWKKE